MQLRITTPERSVLDTEVSEIIAPGSQGAFGLWAEDSDCVSDLVAGVLRYRMPCGAMRYAGLTAGILVKTGPEVTISTRKAHLGRDPSQVARRIRSRLHEAEDLERAAMTWLRDEMERQLRMFGPPILETLDIEAMPKALRA